MAPVLYIVAPCYNEENAILLGADIFFAKLDALVKAGRISPESRVLFVDDGSTDITWNVIGFFGRKTPFCRGLRLSRNCGQQNALVAGLEEARKYCDVAVTMDCDGQDDIDALDLMLDEYEKGSDIVYGVRADRGTDGFFKRNSAKWFYALMNRLGAQTVYNHADFRLVSKKVLDAFGDFGEVNVYLRGIFPSMGFQSSWVTYDRLERIAGETHYSLRKMLSLAAEGITGFSVAPLRLITLLGAFISVISFALIVYTLISYFSGNAVAGWTSTMTAVCFIGGVQMLSIGVIGEYIGKIYFEVKHRPRYIVAEKTPEPEEKKAEKTEDHDGNIQS